MELMLWRWSTTVQLSSLAVIAVTFSVGVSALARGGDPQAALARGGDPQAALKAADESMYRAKKERRGYRGPSASVSPVV